MREQSPLLALPRELRDYVVHEVLAITPIRFPAFQDIRDQAILQTCRQLREEYGTHYYGTSLFDIEERNLKQWLRSLDPEYLPLLRSVFVRSGQGVEAFFGSCYSFTSASTTAGCTEDDVWQPWRDIWCGCIFVQLHLRKPCGKEKGKHAFVWVNRWGDVEGAPEAITIFRENVAAGVISDDTRSITFY